MRHILFCLIVLCLCAAPAFNQTPSNSPQSDADALRQIEADWLQGERTTDIAALQRVLADDYVNLTPRGVGPGKSEIIQHLQPRAGQPPPYSLETSDMHVYVLGDSAVVAYVKTYTSKENGNALREDDTHIFTKENGVWKLKVSRASACQKD